MHRQTRRVRTAGTTGSTVFHGPGPQGLTIPRPVARRPQASSSSSGVPLTRRNANHNLAGTIPVPSATVRASTTAHAGTTSTVTTSRRPTTTRRFRFGSGFSGGRHHRVGVRRRWFPSALYLKPHYRGGVRVTTRINPGLPTFLTLAVIAAVVTPFFWPVGAALFGMALIAGISAGLLAARSAHKHSAAPGQTGEEEWGTEMETISRTRRFSPQYNASAASQSELSSTASPTASLEKHRGRISPLSART